MKRDLDYVRWILAEVEGADRTLTLGELTQDGRHSVNEAAYHIDMMVSHGLLDGRVVSDDLGEVQKGFVRALTWDGADYLDAVRDDGTWKRAKEVIKGTVGSTTLELVKFAAVKVAEAAIVAAI